MKSVCIAVVGLLSLTVLSSGAAITCNGGAQLITIPEDSTEVSTLLTCPGFTLAPSLDGKTAVFLDADGSVSDFILLANVNGAAEFTFVSDLETGQPLTPPPPIIQPEVTEPDAFVTLATSPAGARLQFRFTSDANGVAGQPSETIQITPIPEPASLTLAGIGALLLLCGSLRRRLNR